MPKPRLISLPPGLDWFLPAIAAMVGLAYLFPGPGVMQDPFSLSDAANFAVSLVFFFYGVKLDLAKLKKDLANWRVHLLIQFCTFLIFPLVILILKPLFSGAEAQAIWMGLFFLAALPSTVSSSVVMVSIAEGNITSAIFNASISALIGIFITPLWIGLFLPNKMGAQDLTGIVLKLILQVLVPVLLGMLLHKRFGARADRHKKALRSFDQSVILLIIYTAFSKSFTLHLFEGLSWTGLLLLSAGLLALFFIIMLLMNTFSRLLHLNREDKIAVLFCGSKKSLVHGTVMSGILFKGNPTAGIILLPIMLYHALQLIVSGFLAKRMAPKQ